MTFNDILLGCEARKVDASNDGRPRPKASFQMMNSGFMDQVVVSRKIHQASTIGTHVSLIFRARTHILRD